MERAALMGVAAIAVADVNSVAGIVRAHSAGREIARQVAELERLEAEGGMIGPPAPPGLPVPPRAPVRNVPRLIPAARLVFTEGVEMVALAGARAGWGHLCRMLSAGRLRAEKGTSHLYLSDLADDVAGLQFILLAPDRVAAGWRRHVAALVRVHGARMHLALAPRYDGEDVRRFDRQARLAEELGLPRVAAAASGRCVDGHPRRGPRGSAGPGGAGQWRAAAALGRRDAPLAGRARAGGGSGRRAGRKLYLRYRLVAVRVPVGDRAGRDRAGAAVAAGA